MSLQKCKTLFIVLFSFVLIGFGGYSYIYKSHKSIESAKVNYNGSSIVFLNEVKENTSLWLDKTIVLTGTISQIDENGIILDNSVYCQFKKTENSKLSNQTQITIKGNMIGYDDLHQEVKLNQCVVQK
jgi:hypothetical protein